MTIVFLSWYLLYVLASRLRPRLHGPRAVGQHQRRPTCSACCSSPRRSSSPGSTSGTWTTTSTRSRQAIRAELEGEVRPMTGTVLAADVSGGQQALTSVLFLAFVGVDPRHHRLGVAATPRPPPTSTPAGRSFSGRAERRRDRRRLHVGRVVPRHRRHHRALRVRRLPLLDRLPGGLAGRAAARRRADAQLRQVHDGRRPRRSGCGSARCAPPPASPRSSCRSSTCSPRWSAPARWCRCCSASPRRHGEEPHHRRRRHPDDLLRHGRRHEGHDLRPDHQGAAADDRRHHPDR